MIKTQQGRAYFHSQTTEIMQEQSTTTIMMSISIQNSLLSSGIKIDFVCMITTRDSGEAEEPTSIGGRESGALDLIVLFVAVH